MIVKWKMSKKFPRMTGDGAAFGELKTLTGDGDEVFSKKIRSNANIFEDFLYKTTL